MRRDLLILALLFFTLPALASEPLYNLIVWSKDGTKIAYALGEQPKLTFTETNLIIKTSKVEVNFALANMNRFTYEEDNTSAITNIMTDKSSFVIEEESLLFPLLKANSFISLYSTDGTLVLRKAIKTEGRYVFPLSNLNTGVYLVNVNGITYKIMKK